MGGKIAVLLLCDSWRYTFYVKYPVLGSQYNRKLPGWNVFSKTNCLPFSNSATQSVWRVPQIVFSTARRGEFLADDTYLWDLLLAKTNSRANLAIIGTNYKTSLRRVSFWLQAVTSCSYIHWPDAIRVLIFQVVGNGGSILIFSFTRKH